MVMIECHEGKRQFFPNSTLDFANSRPSAMLTLCVAASAAITGLRFGAVVRKAGL